MIDRGFFFDKIRGDLFKGSLFQSQVDGLSAILDEWDEQKRGNLYWLSYMLATAYHETAFTMQPIEEYGGRGYFMRMYDRTGSRPHVAKRLGNTIPGDGATFAGRGYVQLTGRANYAKASEKLGADFVSHPDLAMQPKHAAAIMFRGMLEGWFTGKKLSDYFQGNTADHVNARRIINGTDSASEIAGYSRLFFGALRYSTASRADPVPPVPEADPIPEVSAKYSWFIQLLKGLFSWLR